MADYYLEFSEAISNLTEPEAAWLADQLQCIGVLGGAAYPVDELPEGVTTGQVEWIGPKFLLGEQEYDESPGAPGFCFEFGVEDAEQPPARFLWLYSEDHADLDQVALLVLKFLQAFRSTEIWTLTYATTCSKPRCGAFGGAGIVTADHVEWHDAELIADKARQQIARQQAASKLSPAS